MLRLKASLLLCIAAMSVAACDTDKKTPPKPAIAESENMVLRAGKPVVITPVTFYPKAKWVTLFEAETVEQDNNNQWILKKPVGHWRLTEEQRKNFEDSFYNIRYLNGDDAWRSLVACEYPRFFFRYYDANGLQIGEVVVDLDSKNFHAYPDVFTYES